MPFSLNTPELLGNLLFSALGFVAFVYGRKQGLLKTTVLGVLLMAYPYFVSGWMLLYGIGALLTLCLFVFKD